MRSVLFKVSSHVIVFFQICSDFVYHVQIVQVFEAFYEILIKRVDLVGTSGEPVLARVPLEIV